MDVGVPGAEILSPGGGRIETASMGPLSAAGVTQLTASPDSEDLLHRESVFFRITAAQKCPKHCLAVQEPRRAYDVGCNQLPDLRLLQSD